MIRSKAALLGIVLVAAAAALIAILAAPTRTFHASGIEFEYPSGWSVHDRLPPSTGFGSSIAVLGTMPWGPCGPSDINCHYYEGRLGPGEIEVRVSSVFLGGSDFCPFASQRPDLAGLDPTITITRTEDLRIDGRPAIRTDYALNRPDYYLADEWRIWKIAFSDTVSRAYAIEASYRGSGNEASRQALDQLIASVHLDPPSGFGGERPADCGGPFPAG